MAYQEPDFSGRLRRRVGNFIRGKIIYPFYRKRLDDVLRRSCGAPVIVAVKNKTDGLASIYTQALHLIKYVHQKSASPLTVCYAGDLYGGKGLDIINE